MPKHLPTFKHLISSSFSSPKSTEKPDRSVNQLIASSRSNEGVRDVPPHPHSPRVWDPGAGDVSVLVACGMAGEAPIHPAELLRRSELARRQASRSVAGPVPPPSWRSATSAKAEASSSALPQPNLQAVTKQDLIRGRSLFSQPRPHRLSSGASLVEHCLKAILLHLESEEVLYEDITIGEAMREQVGYLEAHLKVALLDIAELQPGPRRISDSSIRAVLQRPADSDEGDPDDWAATPPPEIHHLPLVLHPNPLSLLRQLPSYPSLALTSLNLSYSTIKDLERLVTALSGGLRELSLAGIRFANREEVWKKGLALLGKKMIVLKMLDLSYPTIPLTPAILHALYTPERSQLPSLTTLGLRGTNLDSDIRPNRHKWVNVVRDDDETG